MTFGDDGAAVIGIGCSVPRHAESEACRTRHAAAIVHLGNYIALSSATAADGHGGTLLVQGPQTGQQPLSTRPAP
jgi:hypothetical protein